MRPLEEQKPAIEVDDRFRQFDPETWMVPFPGTRKLARLEENIGAAAVGLTSDTLGQIKSDASKIKV